MKYFIDYSDIAQSDNKRIQLENLIYSRYSLLYGLIKTTLYLNGIEFMFFTSYIDSHIIRPIFYIVVVLFYSNESV